MGKSGLNQFSRNLALWLVLGLLFLLLFQIFSKHQVQQLGGHLVRHGFQ